MFNAVWMYERHTGFFFFFFAVPKCKFSEVPSRRKCLFLRHSKALYSEHMLNFLHMNNLSTFNYILNIC